MPSVVPRVKDDLLHAARVDELAHLLARGLHQVGGFLRDGVHAAVHVGLVAVVHLLDGIHHTAWRLRRGSVVKIDQRVPVDLPLQDGIVGAYLVDIQLFRYHDCGAAADCCKLSMAQASAQPLQLLSVPAKRFSTR